MTSWVQRTLVVPSEQVEFARLLTETIAGSSGHGMWTTALSATGAEPATHWICNGLITAEFAALLPLAPPAFDGDTAGTPGQPAICAHLATVAGEPTTTEQVSALFAVADVTTQDVHVAMSRLGLQIINEREQ